jgi:hypothetical protein
VFLTSPVFKFKEKAEKNKSKKKLSNNNERVNLGPFNCGI